MGWETERGDRLKGKDIKRVKYFVYLGGNIYENGRVEVAGGATQNTSRSECMEKCRGGNGGQKDFQETEGEVLDSCVVPASTYGLEMLALSELHQHKLGLQVCENNWIRRIAGVKRVERRKMKDLREEVGTKACIVGKIVKTRMKWAGHMGPHS